MLSIVATPIGNLEDITLRALRIFREADLILCEDTRHTRKLLDHYEIKKPTLSHHQHSKKSRVQQIVEMLKQGRNLALVADAGTPGISDPGNRLIREISHYPNILISQIPGASALTAAASVSGLPCDSFLFLGFIPVKKKRKKVLQEIADSSRTVIFYESCHRIKKTLTQLREFIGDECQIVVARELTKKFETVHRGSIAEILENDIVEKGEFVVIVGRQSTLNRGKFYA